MADMAAQAALITTELSGDPLGRGYAGMNQAEKWTSLSTADRDKDIPTITGADLFNAMDPTEWAALTDTQRQTVRDIFHLSGNIDVSTGSNARTFLMNIFDAGSDTRANIIAVVQTLITRLEEIGAGAVDESYFNYIMS